MSSSHDQSDTVAVASCAGGPPAAEVVASVLEHAIAVVGPDWRIRSLNPAWERIIGPARADAAAAHDDLWQAFPFLARGPAAAALRASHADGVARRFDLERADTGGDGYGIRVARTADGHLVLEIAPASDARGRSVEADQDQDENMALRALARQMAEVVDPGELLSILCVAASRQCGAAGAAVIEMQGSDGVLVAAEGAMGIVRGRRFPLDGSLVREAIQSRGIVSMESFSISSRPLARMAPELRVGPILAAPLTAHDDVLGVLVLVRAERALAFEPRAVRRLRVIADHAALALWKADLLSRAQAADSAKGRFLATISHELRTPLTALTGYEELLADEVLGPLTDAQADVLERMRSVTHHLTAMIEEVLTFSSIEAGGEMVRPTDFLAADLLRAVAAIIEPLARQKHLDLVLDLPDDALRLSSDIDKVRQIVVNLAGNAVKFTDRGQVRLALARRGTDVRFAVRDTGPGIAATDLPRLFRPFSQLDAGLTRRHGGTGLGLYISDRLARLLGGRIEVESLPGEGASFTLTLPSE